MHRDGSCVPTGYDAPWLTHPASELAGYYRSSLRDSCVRFAPHSRVASTLRHITSCFDTLRCDVARSIPICTADRNPHYVSSKTQRTLPQNCVCDDAPAATECTQS